MPPLTGVVVDTADVTDQDFALSRPGAVAGTVHLNTASGSGHRGVKIRVTGPGGTHTITTDGDGNYFLGDQPVGDYRIRVVVPGGYTGVGPQEHTVTITAAGEIESGQDFVITSAATTSPSPSPSATTSPTSTPTSSPSSPTTGPGPNGNLPNTGSAVGLQEALLGGGMLLAGVALAGLAGIRGRGRH